LIKSQIFLHYPGINLGSLKKYKKELIEEISASSYDEVQQKYN